MPTTTPNAGLRKPLSTEAPDGAGQIGNLADDIDQMFRIGGAEYCANKAAIDAIPAARTYKGKLAYAADTDFVWRYDGAAWVVMSGTAALTYSGGWNDFGSGFTSTVRRDGKDATLILGAKNTANALSSGSQSGTQIGTLPAGFRPVASFVQPGAVFGGSWSGITHHTQIGSDGTVIVNWLSAAVPVNSLLSFSVPYVTP